MKWHSDKAIPNTYWRGEEVVSIVRRPFGLTYTIMHRERVGQRPSYFGVFGTTKSANEALKRWLKERNR